MKLWSRSRWFAGLLGVALLVALAGCGSSSQKTASSTSTTAAAATSSSAATTTSAAAITSTSGTPPPAASGPGVGKPAVTIGDKNFTEEYILGALYAQALAAKGYKVAVKGNIGSSEITWKALTSGQIDMYPEYTGTLLTAIAGDTKPPTSAKQTYDLAKSYAEQHGFTLLDQTPFYDSDALAVTKAYAKQHGLTTIQDLGKLGHSLKLGGAPEFATRYAGLVGLKQAYKLNPTFVPLAIGITYKAIDTGQVDAFDAFTTDAQLTSGKYVLLSDPKRVFGFQNVAPVVSKKVVAAEGPGFTQTINKVSALLTLPAIQKMNAAVALEEQSPQKVAHEFLAANGLA
jgi:osmoprotectant transport system substrate-binding protein